MQLTPITPNVILPKLNEADQKKFDQVKQNLSSALETLKSSKKSNDISAQRKAQQKAMAQQRIAQIKQAIKSLRQFQGLDAKATARMIAQLAKQLAQAVKDYQAAGGGDASVSSGTDTSVPSADPAGTTSPESKAANAYTQTQQIVPPESGKEDEAFIRDVNEIKNDLRSFAKQLRNNLKKRFMPETIDPDMKEVNAAEKALEEVDRAISEIRK